MIIWLASYPRSGNTLLRTILKRCFDLNSYADEAIYAESPIRSDNSLIGHKELPAPWEEFYELATKSDQVFLVKTHLPPKDTQPYIYVVRDGRSAVKSYRKYYERYLPGHVVNMYQLIAGDDAYGDWSSHYHSWVTKNRAGGMTVRFEDLGDIGEELLGTIASFIGYKGDVTKWHNPFDALSSVEPGFFREGHKTFAQDEDWPALVNSFFNFFHSNLLNQLGYAQIEMPPLPSEWSSVFQWSQNLVRTNKELTRTCDERLALINRLSMEVERRQELTHVSSPQRTRYPMTRRLISTAIANAKRFFIDWDDETLKASLHFCGRNVKIYHPVIFYGASALDIGDNTSVAPFVHIWCGGRVIIGANCMIGSHVAISSLTHDYRVLDMSKTIIPRTVVIDDGVWIGSHAVILPGVTVGRGAVIGAGSVVTKDVPPNAIVYGVPAGINGYREIAVK